VLSCADIAIWLTAQPVLLVTKGLTQPFFLVTTGLTQSDLWVTTGLTQSDLWVTQVQAVINQGGGGGGVVQRSAAGSASDMLSVTKCVWLLRCDFCCVCRLHWFAVRFC
jgi:hypothetical protein